MFRCERCWSVFFPSNSEVVRIVKALMEKTQHASRPKPLHKTRWTGTRKCVYLFDLMPQNNCKLDLRKLIFMQSLLRCAILEALACMCKYHLATGFSRCKLIHRVCHIVVVDNRCAGSCSLDDCRSGYLGIPSFVLCLFVVGFGWGAPGNARGTTIIGELDCDKHPYCRVLASKRCGYFRERVCGRRFLRIAVWDMVLFIFILQYSVSMIRHSCVLNLRSDRMWNFFISSRGRVGTCRNVCDIGERSQDYHCCFCGISSALCGECCVSGIAVFQHTTRTIWVADVA